MSNDRFVLGLTGNIASGKSVVRQYLENAGAVTLDADLIAQQTYLPGGPAYDAILEQFGQELASAEGQINRSKLGRIVFNDPQAMQKLEELVHPHVSAWFNHFLQNSKAPFIVLEAIKLFESGMNRNCDQVWAVVAEERLRAERLMHLRGFSEAAALQRIRAQSPEEEKVRLADRKISTSGSFAQTYAQVAEGLRSIPVARPGIYSLPGGARFHVLLPENFPQAIQLLASEGEKPWTDEDLYRLLGTHTVLGGFSQQTLTHLALMQICLSLALVKPFYPADLPSSPSATLEAAARFAGEHQCRSLIVAKEMLSAPEAKKLGFIPGEDLIAGVGRLTYQSFLRKHGLMPGEVYQKPLI